jgi:hypothetical protein
VGCADLGDDEVADLRLAFERCGARSAVEDEIRRHTARAEQALAGATVDPVAREQLLRLAQRAAVRDR